MSGKITEIQLNIQRKFITEWFGISRAKLDDYLVQEAAGAEKWRMMETVQAWAKEVGQSLDELTDEQRREILQIIVEHVGIDRNNNVDIILTMPIDDESRDPESPESASPEPEFVAFASKKPSH